MPPFFKTNKMGLFSGDVDMVTVGKQLKTTADIDVYDAQDGTVVSTLPAGSDLGVCDQAVDGTTFMFGYWWLHFSLGWVKFDEKTIVHSDGTQVNSDANRVLPDPVANKLTDFGKWISDMGKVAEYGVIAVIVCVGCWLLYKLFKTSK